MRPRVLVKDVKYCGKYVALRSLNDNTVVGSGKSPARALKQARDAGEEHPVLLYVPPKDAVLIY